jgi:hypothetical protein
MAVGGARTGGASGFRVLLLLHAEEPEEPEDREDHRSKWLLLVMV